MDYTKETVRLFKKGPAGMEVYNISMDRGMIVVESGPMGRPPHRIMHPHTEKPKVDRLIEALIAKGYAPLEKTFAPYGAAKSVDAWRNQIAAGAKRKKYKLGGSFG